MTERLWQVTTPYFCAGVVTGDTKTITEAAPILSWTVGKSIFEVARWANGKGGKVEEVRRACFS